MKITKSKLIQLIKEEVSAVTLGQWTPDGLRNALLRNDTPRKPDDIDDETWNESIRRCLDGHGGYCPLNYGVDKYTRPESKERKRTDLTKLLKPASHYKKKKRKPKGRGLTAGEEFEALFPKQNDECPGCEVLKVFSGSAVSGNLVEPRHVRAGINDFRRAMASQLKSRGTSESEMQGLPGFAKRSTKISRDFYLDIVKNNRQDLPVREQFKRQINRMHNLWQEMNDKQRRWLTKQLYR